MNGGMNGIFYFGIMMGVIYVCHIYGINPWYLIPVIRMMTGGGHGGGFYYYHHNGGIGNFLNSVWGRQPRYYHHRPPRQRYW